MKHMKFKFIYVIIFASILGLNSCGINDNADPIPFFIKISDAKVLLPDGLPDTDKITDIGSFPFASDHPCSNHRLRY